MRARQSVFGFRHVLAAVALAGGLAAAAPAGAASAPTDRQMVDHVLRRFGFSAPPETADALLGANPHWLAAANAWLDQQTGGLTDVQSPLIPLQPPPARLSAAQAQQQAAPCNTVYITWCTDNRDNAYGQVEHTLGTSRQLQAKLELHWIEHFSVVGSNSIGTEMYAYDLAVRKHALGNFQTLLTAVAEQPAELYALSNNLNIGSNPASPPNVNFAREVMQIFSFGPVKLNMDGSEQTDSSGMPVMSYSEADIYALAYAMTGYVVRNTPNDVDPLLYAYTAFVPANHYQGTPALFHGQPLNRFLGQPLVIPPGADPIAYVAGVLARNPSTAPFQAKEMLQRFVMENPPPSYVERIAKVWAAEVDAPDQIAQVVRAIVNDPAFPSSYQSMTKQPIERIFGLLRQMPGELAPLQPPAGSSINTESGAKLLRDQLGALGQDPMYPATVFSFFPVGDVEAMSTENNYTYWLNIANSYLSATAGSNRGVWIDIPTLRQRIAARNGNVATSSLNALEIATYLLGAMIDVAPADVAAANARNSGHAGSDPIDLTLAQLSKNNPPLDADIQAAIWLIAASPQYNLN